jgi:hypothetical protein
MDTARDRVTGALVSAEDLWFLGAVDHERYICPFCGARVIPASYRLGRNKVRPYFSISTGEHALECERQNEARLFLRALTERISSSDGVFPVPYPSQLLFAADGDPPQPPSTRIRRATSSSASGRAPSRERSRGASLGHATVSSLRPLCRFYLRFPYDRDLPLHVPSVEGKSYDTIFTAIDRRRLQRYPGPRIFYAPMRWASPFVTESFLDLPLDAGERAPNFRLLDGRHHRLRIEWQLWSDLQRQGLRAELEVARQEAIDAKKDPARRGEQGWVFFLGEQDAADARLFRLNDHRLVACLVGRQNSFP